MRILTIVVSAVTLCLATLSCNKGGGIAADVRIVYADGRISEEVVTLPKKGGYFSYKKSKQDLQGIDTLVITPHYAQAEAGDDGYFVNAQGYITYFLENRKDTLTYVRKRFPMAMQGIKTPSGCYLEVFEPYRFNMRSIYKVRDGHYSHSLSLELRNVEPYDDFVVDFYPLEGDEASYSGMGRLYRKLQESKGILVPLKDKVKDRPLLKYAVENPEIRIRQAWKPVPCPNPNQTVENEPPMYVKATFDRVCDIVDALKAHGVNGGQLTLVGWNLRGHDGRFPTLFPPEPALGGEERLRHLISYAQEGGYQIVPHICTGDAYRISEDFDEADVAKNADGSLKKDAVYGGGQMYKLCYEASYKKFVQKHNTMLRDLGFRGLEYNDVYSIIPPVVCYDPNHPNNPVQATEWAIKTAQDAIDKIGGFASEGGYDNMVSVLDFCLYAAISGIRKSTPNEDNFNGLRDGHVPIWHIVYNGYIFSCPFSESVNYTIKEPAVAMKIQEYGCHPTFYFYAAHRDDSHNWIGTRTSDLFCGTDEELNASAEAIKKGYDYLQEYGYLQYLFMDDHCEVAPKVFRTTYSDGTVTICNYSDQAYQYQDFSVPANDWHTFKANK